MQLNNSTLKNKLRNYSVLAGSALALTGTANAQVKHTNVNRVLTGSDTLHLDLNGDGLNDFNIKMNPFSVSGIMVNNASLAFATTNATSNSKYVAASINVFTGRKFGYGLAYSAGQVISSKNKFDNPAKLAFKKSGNSVFYEPLIEQYVIGSDKNYGNFMGKTAFLPLKVNSSSGSSYGWVRLYVSKKVDTMKVIDYAYQSIADSSIIAGDTGTVAGVSIHQLQNVSVYSSGKNVFVKYPNAREGMTITVTDLSGREVRSVQTTTELYEMNLSDASSGIYTITVRSKDAEMTKKVSIQ